MGRKNMEGEKKRHRTSRGRERDTRGEGREIVREKGRNKTELG